MVTPSKEGAGAHSTLTAIRVRLAENIALFSGAFIVTLTSIRLMAIAKFDYLSTLAIVSFSDTTSILFGTMLEVLIKGVPVLAIPAMVSWWLYRCVKHRARPKAAEICLFALVAVWSSAVISWQVFAIICLYSAYLAFYGLALPKLENAAHVRLDKLSTKPLPEAVRKLRKLALATIPEVLRAVAVLAIIGLPLFGLISRTPWLPSERVETKASEVFTGFVLKSDDNETVVLRDADRTVLRIASTDLVKRSLCRLPDTSLKNLPFGQDSRTLAEIIAPVRPTYPECPQ